MMSELGAKYDVSSKQHKIDQLEGRVSAIPESGAGFGRQLQVTEESSFCCFWMHGWMNACSGGGANVCKYEGTRR